MKKKNNTTKATEPKEDEQLLARKEALLKEKAKHSVVCQHDGCPRHEHCMLWQAGLYVSPNERTIRTVNTRSNMVVKGCCDFFCDDKPVKMYVGMRSLFYEMPDHTKQAIKKRLIALNCRTTFYRYYSGYRPIPPTLLQQIETICHEEGWTAPLVFDGETVDYVLP